MSPVTYHSQKSPAISTFLHILAASAAACGLSLFLQRRRRRGATRFDISLVVDRRGTHAVKHELSAKREALQLWVADMDLPICSKIQEAITARAMHPVFGYTIQPKLIWERAGAWLSAGQNWPHTPPPSAFVFSASVVSAFCNVLRSLTREGDGVVVMVPSYAPLQQVVTSSGRKLLLHSLPLRTGGRGGSSTGPQHEIDFGGLEATLLAKQPKVLLLINPHNPGGKVWTRAELARLASLCARLDVLVVSDEIWADWVIGEGVDFTPFASVASAAGCPCITMNAPTKTFNLAGLHAAYLVIEDPRLRDAYLSHVCAMPASPYRAPPVPFCLHRPCPSLARALLASICPPATCAPRAHASSHSLAQPPSHLPSRSRCPRALPPPSCRSSPLGSTSAPPSLPLRYLRDTSTGEPGLTRLATTSVPTSPSSGMPSKLLTWASWRCLCRPLTLCGWTVPG